MCRPSPLLLRLLPLLLGWGAPWALIEAAPENNRLANVSARAPLAEGSRVLTVGFSVAAGEPKRVLLRGVGPGLLRHGVADAAANPLLRVFDARGVWVAENEDWSAGLAPTFASVGAFSLEPGSRDAALLLSLPSGGYTAQLLAPQGTGLIEAYDVENPTRIINLSIRGWASGPGAPLVAGLVNRLETGGRRVLVRAIGPGLVPFGVDGVLPDPVLRAFDEKGRLVAESQDWGGPASAELEFAAKSAGAFALTPGSRDAALVLDLAPGAYTFQALDAQGAAGVVLLEVYDLVPVAAQRVGVAAYPAVTSPGSGPAVLLVRRSGKTDTELTVPWSAGGPAVAGRDYAALPSSLTFAAGATETTVALAPLPGAPAGVRQVELRLGSVPGVELTPASATVTLYLGPGTLFVGGLRPVSSAVTSPGSGTVVVRLTPDERFLLVEVAFGGLSSRQTLAYLRMTDGAGRTVELARLPLGQVTGFAYEIAGGAGYSADEVRAALRAGRVWVQLDSERFPTGELSARVAQAAGSTDFLPPASVAPWPGGVVTPREAARFLRQATFGVREAEIDTVVAKGISAWLTEQLALPSSSHRAATLADFAAAPPSMTATAPSGGNRVAAWWKLALTAPDQLRQRVAFALSELWVVSDVNGTLADRQEALAAYYDLLAENAFGDFRTLLEKVTLSPVMGVYLSSLRNAKANPTTGALPDENYAREVMQLFTIGLWHLQPDGTLRLGTDGKPLPTYDQATISDMAKVFTGWGFYSTAAKPSFRGAPSAYFNPMMLYPASHDEGTKTIVSGVVLPAGQGGVLDLAKTLDTLVAHPNTGPFIARQLIQRLVTSNPSPGYVYRVAQVFADDGTGRRGQLGAVVKAILLDPEARTSDAAAMAGQGRLQEPLLRVTGLLRTFEATSPSGRFALTNPENALAQAPLRSPTVFNFFEPGYQPPGLLAEAGLRAPEFQILNANTALSVPNQLYAFFYGTPSGIAVDLSRWLPLAKNPAALLERAEGLLASSPFTPTQRALLEATLARLPANTSDLERVRLIAYLVLTTANGAVVH